LRQFRENIGYVGQEPVLFNETVAENIRNGYPKATDDEIRHALKSANAYNFLNEQEINMHVGTGGGQLSGGQKQRIAIARAFIKKPSILIFDEATSALDKKNEREVQKAIDNIRKELGQVTTIVIAHRLSTIKEADNIIVMKKGVIKEQGTHSSLLREYPEGLYAKLVHEQENAEKGQEQEAEDEVEDYTKLEQPGPITEKEPSKQPSKSALF